MITLYLFLIACCVIAVMYYIIHRDIKESQQRRLQYRLDELREKYPLAVNRHNMPYMLDGSIPKDVRKLIDRSNSEWQQEQEEEEKKAEEAEKRRQEQKHKKFLEQHKNDKPLWPEEDDVALVEKRDKQSLNATLKALSQATQVGNINLAEKKVKELETATKGPNVDINLVDTIDKSIAEYKKKYNDGILAVLDDLYVDYTCPSSFVQNNDWSYAVAKFPTKGSLIFPHRRKKIARRGYMEEAFQEYLEEELSDYNVYVFGDCALLPADNHRPYEPDIAIIDLEHASIRIDVEIDEPYAAISNKPIHYIGCGDDFRDMNLNNLGWIVVRFTEYQVKTDMQGCAAFITQIIYAINPTKNLPSFLLLHAFPEVQKRWTRIEAEKMASKKVREKYLEHKFGIKESEDIAVVDIKQTKEEKRYAEKIPPLKIISAKETTIIKNSRDKDIQFVPYEHVYIYKGRKQFTAVSNVIACFFEPFNLLYWSEYTACMRGVAQGRILEEWDAKGARSREAGTFMHEQIENHYKGQPYQQSYHFEYDGEYVHIDEQVSLKEEHRKFISFLKDHIFKPFKTEWTIYDEDLEIAGTIDMIHKKGSRYDIYDWKRSNKILAADGVPITKNNYSQTGMAGLDNIADTPYWHYCIQQNLYSYILRHKYNIKVDKMYLVVFCDQAKDYVKLEVPRMDNVIDSIISDWESGDAKERLA